MKKENLIIITVSLMLHFQGCANATQSGSSSQTETKIVLLHHSTGNVIYKGGIDPNSGEETNIPLWFDKYNNDHNTSYSISEQAFPKSEPYGWRNYPYDYYNIWVKNASDQPYMEEPTLEMLTKEYDIIIFKHCFPVSQIEEDIVVADINSPVFTLGNYKLQYNALKKKLTEFPDTKFLVWTGAAMVEMHTTEAKGKRAREFASWVKNEWDETGDNIFVWDFFELETEGGIYLKPEYAVDPGNSHPNKDFAVAVLPLLGQRIVDVIENNGIRTNLKGELK